MSGVAVKTRKERDESDLLFKAVADPSRRKILDLLADQELPLMRIEEQFAMSRTAVLKHLHILKLGKLVVTRKQGRKTLHRLNAEPLRAMGDWVARFEVLWEERLLKLKQQVEADT